MSCNAADHNDTHETHLFVVLGREVMDTEVVLGSQISYAALARQGQ